MTARLPRTVATVLVFWFAGATVAYGTLQRAAWTSTGDAPFGFVDVAGEVLSSPIFVANACLVPWLVAVSLGFRGADGTVVLIRHGSLLRAWLFELRDAVRVLVEAAFVAVALLWLSSLGQPNALAQVSGSFTGRAAGSGMAPLAAVLAQLAALVVFLIVVSAVLLALRFAALKVPPAAVAGALALWSLVSANGAIPPTSLASANRYVLIAPAGGSYIAALAVLLAASAASAAGVALRDAVLRGARVADLSAWAIYFPILAVCSVAVAAEFVSEAPTPVALAAALVVGPVASLTQTLFYVLTFVGFAVTFQIQEVDRRQDVLELELIRLGGVGAWIRRRTVTVILAGTLALALVFLTAATTVAATTAVRPTGPAGMAPSAAAFLAQFVVNGLLQLLLFTLVCGLVAHYSRTRGAGVIAAALLAAGCFLPNAWLAWNPVVAAGSWRLAAGWTAIAQGAALLVGLTLLTLATGTVLARIMPAPKGRTP